MSRGNRAAVAGNLSSSMRENYCEHGVEEYYKKVGSTYRNPHYPGIRLCMLNWLNKWWEMTCPKISEVPKVLVFDMAAGSGEVSLAFIEWVRSGEKAFNESLNDVTTSDTKQKPLPRKKVKHAPVPLGSEFPEAYIMAADPLTSAAYIDRTTLPCSPLSFNEIAEGLLPPVTVNVSASPFTIQDRAHPDEQVPLVQLGSYHKNEITPVQSSVGPESEVSHAQLTIEMVVCSFALHLIENSSGLFSLLWELSLKTRWLVILAPHKKPEIKDGWGWVKWNIESWEECTMSDHLGELLNDRVHCRVYKSINLNI